MATSDQARQWAERRFAGHTLASIAADAGVSGPTVADATRRFGPFPQVIARGGELIELDVLHAQWVARRRAGESLNFIAATDQVNHRTIAKATAPWGPFPPPHPPRTWTNDQQWRWTQLRRAGHSATRIAASENVTVHVVRTATRAGGPYPPPKPRVRSADLLSLTDLVTLTGMRAPSVYGWWKRGLLPHPTTTEPRGQPLWDRPVLEAWCDDTLTPCPHCGARALSLSQHITHRHPVQT